MTRLSARAERAYSVTLSPAGEIYTNLERGVIDATEWVGPLHDLRMGFYEAAKYYYYPGWHEPGTYLEYFFNKKIYDGLPKDLQHIIDAACVETEHWVLAQFEARNGQALQTLINDKKAQLIQFPDQVLADLRKLADEVVAEEAAKTPIATKVNDAFKAFQKVVGTWGTLAIAFFAKYDEQATWLPDLKPALGAGLGFRVYGDAVEPVLDVDG